MFAPMAAVASGAMATTGIVLATTDTSSTNPSVVAFLTILQVPVFGALFFAFIRGWIVTGKEFDRVVGERNEEREERIKAQSALTDQVMPVVHSAQDALRQAAFAIETVRTRQQRGGQR